MLIESLMILGLAFGAPDGKAKRIKVVRRVDRAHVVGSPVLDERARPGLYVWRNGGRFRFAVRGRRTTQFHVRSTEPITPAGEDGMVWTRVGPRHMIGRSPSGGRGSVASSGRLTVEKVKRGGRRARIYVGPLAQKGAATVDIGEYGAVRRGR